MPLDEVPRMVTTARGLTVSYKGRLLYSKYSPSKAVIQAVRSLTLLPGTLVVVCSPVLCYGLKELLEALPLDCYVIAVERDDALYQAAREHFTSDDRCVLLSRQDVAQAIRELCYGRISGNVRAVKRTVRLDLSAGVQFDRRFYDDVCDAFTDAIGRYWRNRATLIRFGRLYSRNLFRNLSRLGCSAPLCSVERTVVRPILVMGAGESMESAALTAARMRDKVHIVAVDAALPPLLAMGVVPDDVVTEEAQSVIADAFVGVKGAVASNRAKSHVDLCHGARTRAFLSLTGWRGAFDAVKDWADAVYYATEYCDSLFLRGMADGGIIPPLLPPLGSVGLTAVRLALMMRAAEDVPVFAAGLDFCYSVGTTHARGTPACIKRLSVSDRLHPAEAYGASFGVGAIRLPDGKRTMPNLAMYKTLFGEQFGGTPNLFDAGIGTLGVAQESIEAIRHCDEVVEDCDAMPSFIRNNKDVSAFYQREQSALVELKTLLSSGGSQDRIMELLTPREYLYLHFPDYTAPTLDAHFLRRVRAEVDLFLKDIEAEIDALSHG